MTQKIVYFNKQRTMSGILYAMVSTLLLLSCAATQSNQSSVTGSNTSMDTTTETNELAKYNVNLTITEYIPYCGGAAPTEDQLNNFVAYSGELIVIDLSDQSKVSLLPSEGTYYIQLPVGKYQVREKYKDVPFAEFKSSQGKDGMYYMDGSDECYKKWWKSNLFEFEILNTDTVLTLETNISSRCFTGINPCLQYTGPHPP